jgi:hypothetical protein
MHKDYQGLWLIEGRFSRELWRKRKSESSLPTVLGRYRAMWWQQEGTIQTHFTEDTDRYTNIRITIK